MINIKAPSMCVRLVSSYVVCQPKLEMERPQPHTGGEAGCAHHADMAPVVKPLSQVHTVPPVLRIILLQSVQHLQLHNMAKEASNQV